MSNVGTPDNNPDERMSLFGDVHTEFAPKIITCYGP
jgi:hypothetical protein